MFVDTKVRPQGEQQVGRIKLSEAIRIGRHKIPENRSFFGCAVCAACWATGLEITVIDYPGSEEIFRHLVKRTTATRELVEEISVRHFRGKTSAQLADWLESQGL